MADTGLTLSKFKTLLEGSQPKTLKITVLVNRPDKPKNFTIDWIGLNCSLLSFNAIVADATRFQIGVAEILTDPLTATSIRFF
jgi:hypothetical protein